MFHPEWKKYFDTIKVSGSFLLYSPQEKIWHQVHAGQTTPRHIPASTFKIPNSLIALESGSIKDENEIIKWDGVERMRPEWNADTDMKTAIKNSTVWFYRELARRTGGRKMKMYLDTLNYGNADTSGGVDKFWLFGGLRISPAEQIAFLENLYFERLPFKKENQQTVKRIIFNEQSGKSRLSGKTGLGDEGKTQVGWYVGYVEKNDSVWIFASCITTRDTGNVHFLPARKDIPKKILRDLKLLE